MYSQPGSNITFSVQYALSIIIVLVVCNLLIKSNPQMNTIVIILAGLLVGYISLIVLNKIIPSLNSGFSELYQYYSYKFSNNFNSMGYVNLWPPILAILLIFIILLYNRQLG